MKPMLASKWEERNEKMFPFYVQPKYDGIRVLIGSDGYAYTRSLKLIRNHEFQSMIRNQEHLRGLDAEVIVGDPTAPDCYRRTSSAIMSFESDDIDRARLYVFDSWNHPGVFEERMNHVEDTVGYQLDWTHIAENTLVETLEELNQYEEQMVSIGNEGVIARKHDMKYKFGRGTPKQGQLIKIKRFEDAEGEIIGQYERLHNGNEATISELGYTKRSGHKENLVPRGDLGGIIVKLGNEWEADSVRVGSGFDDAMRKEYWESSLIGKIAKYRFFMVGSKDKPRFPTFLGIRDKDDMSEEQGSLF
jgi:DNA ligase-1